MKSKISARIIADSVNPQGNRITAYELVFPRFILAELNTHRVFSKNSASSRAIPFKKMKEMVINDPFIPIAWQKNHSGMQGTEYLSKTEKYNLVSFVEIMTTTLHRMIEGSEEYGKLAKELDEKLEIIETSLMYYTTMTKTLDEWWLFARDKAVEAASIMYVFGVTKQLANRLLEPFMWHKVLLTATEFENFFNLRCPIYRAFGNVFKSKKDCIKKYPANMNLTDLDWLQSNESQAEIHIQALAEAMYDAMNESTPVELKAGEWHIPYGDNVNYEQLGFDTAQYYKDNPNEIVNIDKWALKVATARCARLSYQTVGDNPKIDYEADIRLHDRLLKMKHLSPFEHVAICKESGRYANFKGWQSYRNALGY